ncbi:hypothetical protein [Streptosporangium sp. NPDC001681]|uniref:hypothetical protein n=1 Tax=Streptosporangium sp. NPDC001681 TaxID=3154395 RepID=UPI0033291431
MSLPELKAPPALSAPRSSARSGPEPQRCRDGGSGGELGGHQHPARPVPHELDEDREQPRDAAWQKRLTPVDRRVLSALFWTHLNLYGRFELDMNRHLELDGIPAGPSADVRSAPGL